MFLTLDIRYPQWSCKYYSRCKPSWINPSQHQLRAMSKFYEYGIKLDDEVWTIVGALCAVTKSFSSDKIPLDAKEILRQRALVSLSLFADSFIARNFQRCISFFSLVVFIRFLSSILQPISWRKDLIFLYVLHLNQAYSADITGLRLISLQLRVYLVLFF